MWLYVNCLFVQLAGRLALNQEIEVRTLGGQLSLRISMVEDQVVNLGDVGSSPIVSALV